MEELSDKINDILIEELVELVGPPFTADVDGSESLDAKVYLNAKERYYNPTDTFDKALAIVLCYFNRLFFKETISEKGKDLNGQFMLYLSKAVTRREEKLVKYGKFYNMVTDMSFYITERALFYKYWNYQLRFGKVTYEEFLSILNSGFLFSEYLPVNSLRYHTIINNIETNYSNPSDDDIRAEVKKFLQETTACYNSLLFS